MEERQEDSNLSVSELGDFVKYYQDGVKIVERPQIYETFGRGARGEICFLELSHRSRLPVHQKLSRYKLQVWKLDSPGSVLSAENLSM